MSLGGKPKAPKPAAKRPERTVDVTPEEIQLGSETTETSDLKKAGKRSLIRPSGSYTTGLSI